MGADAKNNEKWELIAEITIGDTGMPGSHYHMVWMRLWQRCARWRVTAKEDWGSNQGHLESHGSNKTEGRGDTFTEAIQSVREDVLTWADDDNIQIAKLRSALRSLAYQAEDLVKPTSEV